MCSHQVSFHPSSHPICCILWVFTLPLNVLVSFQCCPGEIEAASITITFSVHQFFLFFYFLFYFKSQDWDKIYLPLINLHLWLINHWARVQWNQETLFYVSDYVTFFSKTNAKWRNVINKPSPDTLGWKTVMLNRE